MSRMALFLSASSAATAELTAHAAEQFPHIVGAGARMPLGRSSEVAQSTRSFWNRPPSAISIRLTVQLPPTKVFALGQRS